LLNVPAKPLAGCWVITSWRRGGGNREAIGVRGQAAVGDGKRELPAWLMDSVLKGGNAGDGGEGLGAQERAAALGAGDGHIGRVGSHHVAVLVLILAMMEASVIAGGSAGGLLGDDHLEAASGKS